MSATDSNTSNLTDYDWKVYNLKLQKMFKGTIAVCIIYAVIAAILIALSYAFSSVRDILFVQFLPFTIIYIIGTIIIIIALIIYIMTFQPTKVDYSAPYPDMSCPDYWDMEILNESSSNLFDKAYNTNLFKYRCVLNSNLFKIDDILRYNPAGTYNLTDSYAKTGVFDILDNNAISSIQNDNDNKYRHLYKNINNASLSGEVYSNLLNSALVMNNYQFDTRTNQYINLQSNTSNYAIPPISWKFNGGVGLQNISTAATYIPIIKNWNGLNYDILKANYGQNNVGVYLRNSTDNTKKGVQLGTIILNNSNANLTYIPITQSSITINSTIINSILDVILVSPSSAQTQQQAVAATAYTNSLNTAQQNAILAASATLGQTLTPGNAQILQISCTINDILTPNNSDLLGIPSPYVEYVPAANNNFLPSQITTNQLYSSNSNIPLLCDSFYPLYMSYADNNTSSNLTKNALRCQYANLCGIPWSDMQCSSTSYDYMNDYIFSQDPTVTNPDDFGKLGIKIDV